MPIRRKYSCFELKIKSKQFMIIRKVSYKILDVSWATDLIRRAKKQVRKAQKYPLFDDRREEFGDFSFSSASFLSEAGTVLIFLPTFCIKAKSGSGFGAESPK